MPENEGISELGEIGRLQYSKHFELELSNMEGTPVYALTHQLSIGSEIGNIIISDPSVSPRHATFILQQDVVSVIDHGSVVGTKVNGTVIPSGKYIILEETDVVSVGDLELRLRVSTKASPIEEAPALPVELQEATEEKSIEAPVVEKRTEEKKTKTLKLVPVLAANSVVRVFAVIGDFLLAYSILVIFSPFDEFRSFLQFIPEALSSLMGMDASTLIDSLIRDAGFAGDMIRDGVNFISNTFHFGPILLVFALIRVISTFLFGVSVSELLMGMRATGNRIWARLGGVLRVLIGFVTGPLILFDTPAIISRRTLKELLTFTKVTVPSSLVATLGVIVFIPALIGLALVSPLVQGFEPPQSIIVDERVDQRVKVDSAQAETLTKDQSTTLGLELSYDPKELLIIPNFKFQGVNAKLNLKSSLIFYERSLQRPVDFEVYKKFDFRQLLGIGMKGNVPLYDKYPEIYNFVYEAMDSNPAFKLRNDEKAQLAFANEFIQFTKSAFALGPENALDLIRSESFLIRGLVDYKSSFLSLIEYKDFDRVGFIKLGNTIFMKIRYLKQKPFDLIMPLQKGEGRIYKVSFDRRENLGELSTQFYKFNFGEANWLPELRTENREILSPLSVFDLFNSGKFREGLLKSELAQSFYGYYFETSGAVLGRGDQMEINIWKEELKNIPKLIEAIPSQATTEGFDPKAKLKENFQDLIDALENNNVEYFGLTQSTTL